jgi:uracil-DNA glycosylase
VFSALAANGLAVPARTPRFAHGAEVPVAGGPTVLGCFHVSQQNTFTGRLTEQMLDDVLGRAKELAGLR